MRKVLLLNSSYEPLQIWNINHAMAKLSRDPANVEVIEFVKGETMRSAHQTHRIPSVLKMKYYVHHKKRRKRDTAKNNRHLIYVRDKWHCQYCGKNLAHNKKELTLDHILPSSRGGLTIPSNLVTCCQKCNNKKGDRTPREAKMILRISPTLLKLRLDQVSLYNWAEKNPSWKPYLFLDGSGEESLHSIEV